MTTRNWLLFILALPAFALAYYFAVALPENQKARLDFDRERYQTEKKEQVEREAKLKEERDNKQIFFDACVADAVTAYWSYVKLNGEPVKGKPDTYNAPTTVWDTADKRKTNAIAECHRLYDK